MTLRKLLLIGAVAFMAAPAFAQAPVAAPAAAAAAPHERLVALEGARNFRDLGGYRTADGRTVKWGQIYRSAELSGLTAADAARLDATGVKTIYDLRSTAERKGQPTDWTGANKPTIRFIEYDMDNSALAVLARPGVTETDAREAFATFYPAMLKSHAPQFKAIFQELLTGGQPVLYHCSAGKDRTGVASALILTALGVPRETVVQDYLLSNRYYTATLRTAAEGMPQTPEARMVAAMPPAVVKVLMGVDAPFMNAVFAEMDRTYGGPEGYLSNELGVGPLEIARLKSLYLE